MLSVGVFSFSLICESSAVQFQTFVPHGEQTFMNKDSPSLRKMKSLFFRRLANFGNVSPFLVGATNIFSELIHPLLKLNCVVKQHPHIRYSYLKRSALSTFSLFKEQTQALSTYCHFHSFLISHKTPHCTGKQG